MNLIKVFKRFLVQESCLQHLERAWYGTHHHYSKLHAFAYAVEACYKYNIRKVADPFRSFLNTAVTA